LESSGTKKTSFELTRAYPIGCTLNSVYTVTGIVCSTAKYNLYRARDRRTGRNVTIKELTRAKIAKEAQADMFQSEIRALNRARHPNLPLMLDHFSDRGNLYIVFEQVTGMCLGEMLSAEGPLSADLVFPIFLEIAQALGAAHEAGVFHNELTPSSIFLLGDSDATQIAKLIDFGGATIKEDSVRLEGCKSFRPEYASPEALKGEETDARSDIYSIGVILYTTLTGRLPFACQDVDELIECQMKGLPRRFKESAPELDIPFHVEATVFKCLAKDKEDRFQSAPDLAKWLRSWRHSSQQVEAEPVREVAAVDKSYTISDLNRIGAPKSSPITEFEPPQTIVLPDTASSSKETKYSKPRESSFAASKNAANLEATARAKAKAEESAKKKAQVQDKEKEKSRARELAKAQARAKAEEKEMRREAEKLQKRSFKKREVPIFLVAAVALGAVGFIVTVNVRHAMNAKQAEREAFNFAHSVPEHTRRLIAAREQIAAAESNKHASSNDSNAVNQEAPLVPVAPGEPVIFEGESGAQAPSQPNQKQDGQSSQSPDRNAPSSQVKSEARFDTGNYSYQTAKRRHAYQTSYTQ